ncbi:hypothetical protein [Chroococcidiopsis thermalis]|uniref:Uncharacterized protein n=1 Tax=Chroococcidiopsis thermalis (strain PCC 7203) TaxID=251229 RepID=K9TWZ2_CHRTP|nr:hypothetical protein [Chroococcidiopsis thermalis]AFY86706.1 hypothetical protein Chro_1179 [Chroococcidiopsis thermalis PCC 7203]
MKSEPESYVFDTNVLFEESKKPPVMKHWEYLPSLNVLRYAAYCNYEIDLDRCNDWVEIVDWIFHIHQTKDFNPEVLSEFIEFCHWYFPDQMEDFYAFRKRR